jgi:hypothetical protein
VERCGAAVGGDFAGLDSALELLRAAPPKERRLAAIGGEPRVEEDGKAELSPDTLCERERRVACKLLVLWAERHEGDNVRGADPRVCALVLAQIDPFGRSRDPGEQGVHEVIPGADDREDRAVMVPVGVDVEKARRSGERAFEG